MRNVSPTTRFDRDYKRVSRGVHKNSLPKLLGEVISLLANDLSLPARFRDHALAGNWADHRDCHLHPDLVLIYRKPDLDTLQLVRLGSHSEIEL